LALNGIACDVLLHNTVYYRTTVWQVYMYCDNSATEFKKLLQKNGGPVMRLWILQAGY